MTQIPLLSRYYLFVELFFPNVLHQICAMLDDLSAEIEPLESVIEKIIFSLLFVKLCNSKEMNESMRDIATKPMPLYWPILPPSCLIA